MFEHTLTPSVVVRPESNKDIVTTIQFATKHAVPFAIRSGGHGSIDSHVVDEMLLIDMSHFNAIEVIDTDKGLVRIGAGALWHEAMKDSALSIAQSSPQSKVVIIPNMGHGVPLANPTLFNLLLETWIADGMIIDDVKQLT